MVGDDDNGLGFQNLSRPLGPFVCWGKKAESEQAIRQTESKTTDLQGLKKGWGPLRKGLGLANHVCSGNDQADFGNDREVF